MGASWLAFGLAATLQSAAALQVGCTTAAPRSFATMQFDKRQAGKLDVSYQVAGLLNKSPGAFATLKKVLGAAEKELKGHPVARRELGSYVRTDNIIGYGERPGGVVMLRFFGIYSRKVGAQKAAWHLQPVLLAASALQYLPARPLRLVHASRSTDTHLSTAAQPHTHLLLAAQQAAPAL